MHFFHLVNALSRVRVAPRDRATARAVRESLALHRKWAAASPANYAAPYELIEWRLGPGAGRPGGGPSGTSTRRSRSPSSTSCR